MRALFRLPRRLFDDVNADLSRPHPFAGERVGFVLCRSARLANSSRLALGYSYLAIDDAWYVRDPWVGARIGVVAIRTIMQHVLNSGDGAFHVHRHDHSGQPWFSPTDLGGLAELIPPLAAVGPGALHGGLVLSTDGASSIIWLAGESSPIICATSLVGYPTLVRRKPRWQLHLGASSLPGVAG